MNSVSAHPSCMMMLISIFTATMLINFTHSAPLSYAAYGRRELSETDRPQILVLVDQRMPELETEMFDSGSGPESTMARSKRIGSLSIVNSLDVLRQRVLLELARRKALQDQRQIDANRRFLESIGKRSVATFENNSSKMTASRLTSNDHNYAAQEGMENDDQSTTSSKSTPDRKQAWFDQDQTMFPERQDDQSRRVQPNVLRFL